MATAVAKRPPIPAGPPAVRLGGEPLSPRIQEELEQSFQADFRSVRVHTGTNAQNAATSLSARAFTYGNNIFLGPGERPTDLGLMAHETAHVVQQQGAPTLQRAGAGQSDVYEREAHQASAAVTRGESFTVQERTSAPRFQRLGISDALDYFADKANLIPGFRMFTIILGVNPINMSRVERTAANILRGLIEFIPGGTLISQALANHGIFEKVGKWIEQQIQTLGMVGSAIKQAVTKFVDSLGLSDLFRLGDVWNRAKRIFTEPIDRIINFAKGLATGIITFIKDAILLPLAKLAEGTRGYDLLKAILGKDPVTGDPVARTPELLIGGFMKLIGQEEIWENIKKANAIGRAWAWFQGAMSSLVGLVNKIPAMFVNAFRALEIMDIVLVPRAFAKILGVFGNFVGQFLSWAGNAVWNLLEIIFAVVAPGVMQYLNKAKSAFRTILKNPVGFVGNLVRAAKLGFEQFAAKFGQYLKASLIQWLTGSLGGAGVYIPQSFEIREIIKFVLSVLGLTWKNIRQKLVKVLGETVVKVLEAGFEIVTILVTQGPAAAWEKIKEQLTNLKEMVIEQIMNFVITKVVQSAVIKLVSMLNPAGAIIQAIIAIYNTIMFFVERLKQIIQVVTAFIDSLAAIAAGVIGAAANRVEKTLGGLLTLVISFLARLVGLGKVTDIVINIINKIRAPIDKAMDKVVDWIVTTARKFLGKKGDAEKEKKLQAGLAELDSLSIKYKGGPPEKEKMVSEVKAIKAKHPVFKLLSVEEDESGYVYDYSASPGKKKKGPVFGDNWTVAIHVADPPKNAGAGESHHVPAKVFKQWIGEVLEVASTLPKRSHLLQKAAEAKADPEGKGLSAIWLAYKDHKTAHKPSKDSQLAAIRSEIINTKLQIETAAGMLSAKPMQATLTRAVHEETVNSATSTAKDQEERIEEIVAAKQSKLGSLFQDVFESLLGAGIGFVARAKLKPTNKDWKAPLRALAKSTWAKYLRVPKK